MLRETKMTAILIEFAFMTNKNEALKMRTAEYQKKTAKAIVDGLVAQYGLKRKPELTASTNRLYRVQVGAFSDINNAKDLVEELMAKGYSAMLI